MLIELPRTENKPPIIIKSENIQVINIFPLVFVVWLKNDDGIEYNGITCPISVLPRLRELLDIVDLTKTQKDPF